jgi:hypothetical protein
MTSSVLNGRRWMEYEEDILGLPIIGPWAFAWPELNQCSYCGHTQDCTCQHQFKTETEDEAIMGSRKWKQG